MVQGPVSQSIVSLTKSLVSAAAMFFAKKFVHFFRRKMINVLRIIRFNFFTFRKRISQYQLPIPWSESNMFWKKRESFLHLPLNLCKIIHIMPLIN